MTIFTRLLLVLVVFVSILDARAQAETARILLVGDSWASRAWDARAFRTALQNKGFDQIVEKGDATAIGGTKAAHWATPDKLETITSELSNNPEIDIVHLSLGANDYGFAPPGTHLPTLLAEILADIQTIVDHILNVRPEARIVWASYDYLPLNLNAETAIVGEALALQALSTPNFFVLNNMGVLHHEFGYPDVFGPGETPLPGSYPQYEPRQGGDPDFPGSPEQFDDTVHPNVESLVVLAEYAIDKFYGSFLAPPAVPSLQGVSGAILAGLLAALGHRRLRRRRC